MCIPWRPGGMGSMVWMSLWAWMILDSGVCAASLPEITDGNFIEECVREHNRARSSVSPAASNMLYMTWDAGLAITARAWASKCLFEHNIYLSDARRVHPAFRSVGENLWAGSPPSSFDVTRAVKTWVDEKQHYDYNLNGCTGVCGHYTQVVWASSYKVGCAAQLCPSGVKGARFASQEGVIFVCNYAPGGNIVGRTPYQYGSCAECDGTCEGNLCRNPERDSQKSYSWTPDWDTAKDHAGVNTGKAADRSSYVAVLVVRPIALIATFTAAYAVRHFYPDVFCYE